jgi:hypothetical protein
MKKNVEQKESSKRFQRLFSSQIFFLWVDVIYLPDDYANCEKNCFFTRLDF